MKQDDNFGPDLGPPPPPLYYNPEDTRCAYGHAIVRDVPLEDFVRRVYGFTVETIPRLHRGQNFLAIHGDDLHRYLLSAQSSDPDHLSSSPSSSVLLQSIFRTIVSQLDLSPEGLPNGDFHERTDVDEHDRKMPSLVFSSLATDPWDLIGTAVDVVKTGRIESVARGSRWLPALVVDRRVVKVGDAVIQPSFKYPHNEIEDVQYTVYTQATYPLTDLELVSATNISAMRHRSLRAFGTSITVDSTKVTAYYGDAFTLIKSTAFDFVERPDLLVLLIGAIYNASPAQLGFAHFVDFPRYKDVTCLNDLRIRLPCALNANGVANGPWYFDIHVTDLQELFTDDHPLGRTTAVVPLRLENRLDDYPNTTTAAKATDLVLKYSFQDRRWAPEDHTLRVILKKVSAWDPRASKYLPELVCSANASVLDVGLPSIWLGTTENYLHTDRRLSVMVVRAMHPLASLRDVAGFRKVYKDCVRAHKWVYTLAGILHRDFTINNMMYYVDGEEVFGVINDFDLSRSVDAINEEISLRRPSVGKVRPVVTTNVGAACYQSVEIAASPDPPVQEYRHDLESAFFALCWQVATHNPETMEYRDLEEWEHPDSVMAARIRAAFLRADSDTVVDDIMKDAHYLYKRSGIIDSWVKPLRHLFKRSAYQLAVQGAIEFKEDKKLTLKKLRARLFRTPMPQYANFMDAIGGEPTDM
ncbi:hypothetical protein EIP91_002571 [Steccherinum ochraceum]|uniref:Fungal-type protein kinase domain-containing protein n=1 Tax=Steccherinum ochraceum TaxID=92696 RepID=A0A4V2MWA8_9APHY|nr:hypothetical protein EIP91_002571 [Steccherinum ochraceum]